MNRRLGMAAVISASALFAFGGGAVLTHAARAQGGAEPNLGCSSASPCLEEDNTLSGPGLKGVSPKSGIIGQTHAKGTLTTNNGSGVLGQDTNTTNGFTNAGVTGTSKNGIGVAGTSTSGRGLSGVSTSGVGIFGISANNDGILGQSTNDVGVEGNGLIVGVDGVGEEGVEGNDEGSASRDAIFANGHGANLFRGNNSASQDVFLVDNSGNTTIGGTASISGDAVVAGVNQGNVVEGVALSGAGDNILANSHNSSAFMFRGNNAEGQDVFEVSDNGNVNAVSYTATLAMTTIQKTTLGRSVKTYAAQASQPSLEDFGEAQLTDGRAYVSLDPSFSSSIDRSTYLVVVTAEGDTNGLYVTNRSQAGFEVRENRGGRSTVAFSYRILARPFGNTSARLPIANDVPRNFMRYQEKRSVHVPAVIYDPKPKS